MPHCYLFMGPSGSGKTTLAESFFKPQQKIISYTTRPARPSEKDGLDYHFISKDQFKAMIIANQFAEFDVYDNHYYGIALDSIKQALAKGDCYDPITPPGFFNLYKIFGETIVPVWIDISKETLAQRLGQRATKKELDRRLALYEKDLRHFLQLKKIPHLIVIDGEQSPVAMLHQLKNALS